MLAAEAIILAQPIKITIKGKTSVGIDAPTVEDLLSQIQDFIAVLRGVEEAVADGEGEEIDWRITDASRNSPLTFEVTPFPKQHAMNIDNRAKEVVLAASSGINSLMRNAERPLYFSDVLISKVAKMFDRVSNGLSETRIDVSAYDGVQEISVTEAGAPDVLKRIQKFKSPEPISYREIGSIEGFVAKIELDGFRRPILWLRHRLDNQLVKCVSNKNGLARIGHYEVAEVLKGLRVQVFGLINYKDLEKISSIDVDGLHVFPRDDELPDIADIVTPGFTGGLEATEFLRVVRKDG